MKTDKWATEAQLLGWASGPRGQTITLLLPDEESLAPFRALTLAKGKQVGQRLGVGFAVIGDDEQILPVETDPKVVAEGEKKRGSKSHLPPGLTGLAVRWCGDRAFQTWLYKTHLELWTLSSAAAGPVQPADIAKLVVCDLCDIKSRTELDSNKRAATLFQDLIRVPYQKHLEDIGAK